MLGVFLLLAQKRLAVSIERRDEKKKEGGLAIRSRAILREKKIRNREEAQAGTISYEERAPDIYSPLINRQETEGRLAWL